MSQKTEAVIKDQVKLKKPSLYSVIIHNDDVTTMDYVVEVLVEIFSKTPIDAAELMMDVHEKGHGVAGTFIFDIAATKKAQCDMRSAERGFPLKLTIVEVQNETR